MEQCLNLMDVIWTPGRGVEKHGGKSLRSKMPLPLDATVSQPLLYPFQGNAFRVIVATPQCWVPCTLQF